MYLAFVSFALAIPADRVRMLGTSRLLVYAGAGMVLVSAVCTGLPDYLEAAHIEEVCISQYSFNSAGFEQLWLIEQNEDPWVETLNCHVRAQQS